MTSSKFQWGIPERKCIQNLELACGAQPATTRFGVASGMAPAMAHATKLVFVAYIDYP
jgi:hypothetical protein